MVAMRRSSLPSVMKIWSRTMSVNRQPGSERRVFGLVVMAQLICLEIAAVIIPAPGAWAGLPAAASCMPGRLQAVLSFEPCLANAYAADHAATSQSGRAAHRWTTGHVVSANSYAPWRSVLRLSKTRDNFSAAPGRRGDSGPAPYCIQGRRDRCASARTQEYRRFGDSSELPCAVWINLLCVWLAPCKDAMT